jgi:SNF2 family DNA or RNA helicase
LLDRASRYKAGVESFLQQVNPFWHSLGRVTFHLAENKRDAERPFAFLATYAQRVSATAKLQHLPLAEAVKQSAGAKDQAKLAALLEPVRRAAEKSKLVSELLASRAIFQPQAWSVRQAHRFLSEAVQMQEAGVVVRLPDWWRARHASRPQVRVSIGQKKTDGKASNQLLDFNIGLTLGDETLTEEEYENILQATESLVLLRGKWIEVDQQSLQQVLEQWQQVREQHADGLSMVEGMRLLAGATLDGKDVVDAPTQEWSRITAGSWLQDTLAQMRDPQQITDFVPGRELNATLRPYQADGVRWLWFMTKLGLGACLADDMGLGKTIQVIDLLLQLKAQTQNKKAVRRTSMLVVPASLVGNWKQEFEKFAPSLKVMYAHKSECAGETLQRLADKPEQELRDYDAVVTTYTLVRSSDWPAKMPWRMVVLDEAQAIKNAGSAQTRAVKKLDSQGRIILSGTPVENHLGDLWSLFDFCSPGLLGSAAQFKTFVKQLNQRQDGQAYGSLRKLVRPYILRRLKTDPLVATDLPEKTEMRTDCGLAKRQAVLYERAVQELVKKLDTYEGIARRGLVLAALMQLKQICNHPAQYLAEANFPAAESGKMQRLAQLCEPIAERQERVLIFTQFQSLTAPLAEFLAEVFGQPGLVLHGGTPVGKRKELVKQFQSEQGPPFFVISLKAGGSGLNLTAASHVIHFDRWWNPAVENQATDRAFRIGQKRNVLVHKFVCRGTLEERIDDMIRTKQALANEVLGEDGGQLLTEMNNDELLRFVSLDISRAASALEG